MYHSVDTSFVCLWSVVALVCGRCGRLCGRLCGRWVKDEQTPLGQHKKPFNPSLLRTTHIPSSTTATQLNKLQHLHPDTTWYFLLVALSCSCFIIVFSFLFLQISSFEPISLSRARSLRRSPVTSTPPPFRTFITLPHTVCEENWKPGSGGNGHLVTCPPSLRIPMLCCAATHPQHNIID